MNPHHSSDYGPEPRHEWQSLVLGAGHGVHDFISAWVVVHAARESDLFWVLAGYNAMAFAMQPLWGFLVDRYAAARPAACIGLAGALSVFLAPAGFLAVLCQGFFSALFHVGAGAWAARLPRPQIGMGIFAAPGVLGLALGTVAALSGWQCQIAVTGALAAVLVILAATAAFNRVPGVRGEKKEGPGSVSGLSIPSPALRGVVSGMLAFAAVTAVFATASRSSLWLSLQERIAHDPGLIVLIGGIACAGKFVGGLGSHCFGARRWIAGAALAMPLLWLLAGKFYFLGLAAVLLLQSLVPPLWRIVDERLPGNPAVATGISLGFAFALGGLPALSGIRLPAEALLGMLIVCLLLCASVRPEARDPSTVPSTMFRFKKI